VPTIPVNGKVREREAIPRREKVVATDPGLKEGVGAVSTAAAEPFGSRRFVEEKPPVLDGPPGKWEHRTIHAPTQTVGSLADAIGKA